MLIATRMTSPIHSPAGTRYELRFQSLHHPGRALSFPCDSEGHVQLDTLSDKVHQNYLDALAGVGRTYAIPIVRLRNHR
jgi:hypothetical protein